MLIQQLRQQGQFLHLSRRNPESFSKPLEFSLNDGCHVSISAPGIICFSPNHHVDKSIVLSCGVHGNETAPIEICDQLVKAILTGKLTVCQRVLFLFANLPAMDNATRFIDENLNRLFSGAHSEGAGLCNQERRRALQLEQAVSEFFHAGGDSQRCHYDLHTAIRASKNTKFAVYPFLHGKKWQQTQLDFLAACGVKTILLSESPTTTFSYYSSHQHGADGFTVELGKVRPFGENNMTDFQAVSDALQSLLSVPGWQPPRVSHDGLLVYRINQVINKHQQDFMLHFADDTPNFTDYPAGTLLASESGADYYTQQDGEAIVFPNAQVALGQRALLTVVPTDISKQCE